MPGGLRRPWHLWRESAAHVGGRGDWPAISTSTPCLGHHFGDGGSWITSQISIRKGRRSRRPRFTPCNSIRVSDEVTTGGATPLHVCGMSQAGQRCTALIAQARAGMGCDVDARDTWGYTALQRHATNNLGVGAQALLEAGASHTVPSGFADSGTRDSARQLALRLRAFACLKVFQQHELSLGQELPDGEIEL